MSVWLAFTAESHLCQSASLLCLQSENMRTDISECSSAMFFICKAFSLMRKAHRLGKGSGSGDISERDRIRDSWENDGEEDVHEMMD